MQQVGEKSLAPKVPADKCQRIPDRRCCLGVAVARHAASPAVLQWLEAVRHEPSCDGKSRHGILWRESTGCHGEGIGVGLFIEVSFIATFTQHFFAR
jgi:hypothetical protein